MKTSNVAADSRSFDRSGSSPPPIPLDRCREILGPDYANVTDDELLEMRGTLYALAAITLPKRTRRDG